MRHRRSGILIDRSTQETFQQKDKTPVERFAHLFASAFEEAAKVIGPKRAKEVLEDIVKETSPFRHYVPYYVPSGAE